MKSIPSISSGYENFVKERFERCLDLYLCPRKMKRRLNIDPETLVPRLPKPSELRPYPNSLCIQYLGMFIIAISGIWILTFHKILPLYLYLSPSLSLFLFLSFFSFLPSLSPPIYLSSFLYLWLSIFLSLLFVFFYYVFLLSDVSSLSLLFVQVIRVLYVQSLSLLMVSTWCPVVMMVLSDYGRLTRHFVGTYIYEGNLITMSQENILIPFYWNFIFQYLPFHSSFLSPSFFTCLSTNLFVYLFDIYLTKNVWLFLYAHLCVLVCVLSWFFRFLECAV